jgi:hypothetical protein
VAKLPNIDAVIVEDAKLTEYLLNPAHPRGAAKANFLARFGFSAERPEQAREAFLEHARQYDFSASQQTRFGVIFEVDGPLPSPDGRNPYVRTVWMLDDGATAPRLITMVPGPKPRATRSDP